MSNATPNHVRRPWVAALLSFGVSGLGHLYAGAPRAAVYAFLFSGIVWPVALASWLFPPLAPLNILLSFFGMLLVYYVGIPLHAGLTAKRAAPGYRLRRYNRWYIYLGAIAFAALVVQPALHSAIKTRVSEAFRVHSGAMEPTIRVGDFLFVAKWRSAVESAGRGAIVVHESTEEPGLHILKRIVGIPGDTLEMKNGTVFLNGVLLKEPYAVHNDPDRSEDPIHRSKMREWQAQYRTATGTQEYTPDLQDWGPIAVPADSFFGLGDNRDSSYDSRYYGFVPLSRIRGRPWVVYLSYDRSLPGPVLSRIRWDRIGQRFH